MARYLLYSLLVEELRPFQETAPGIVTVRQGGGVIALFGAPFLLAGSLVALFGLGIFHQRDAVEVPGWVGFLSSIAGLAFVMVGGVFVFGRRWIVIDRGRGRVVSQSGLLVPMRTDEQILTEAAVVALVFRAGDADSVDTYEVAVAARRGGPFVKLYSSGDYGESRARAAFLCRRLNLPLDDASTQHEVLLEADAVNKTLQQIASVAERIRASGNQPQFLRCKIQESGQSVQIIIPGSGIRLVMLLPLLIPVGVLSPFIARLPSFDGKSLIHASLPLFLLELLCFVFGFLPVLCSFIAVIWAVRRRTRVIASVTGVTIEERSYIRTRLTEIPADEILDLDYSSPAELVASAKSELQAASQTSKEHARADLRTEASMKLIGSMSRWMKSGGVIIKSKRGIFSFGEGLPDEEILYLHMVLRRALGTSGWQSAEA